MLGLNLKEELEGQGLLHRVLLTTEQNKTEEKMLGEIYLFLYYCKSQKH